MQRERVIRYWPHDKPIPEGWVKCGEFISQPHASYSILIEQLEGKEKPDES